MRKLALVCSSPPFDGNEMPLPMPSYGIHRVHAAAKSGQYPHDTEVRFFDIGHMGAEAGLKAWLIVDDPEATSPLFKSDWVLVTDNEALLFLLKDRGKGIPLEGEVRIRPWTDDFNNLFDVLK